jgi:hypothetical protein
MEKQINAYKFTQVSARKTNCEIYNYYPESKYTGPYCMGWIPVRTKKDKINMTLELEHKGYIPFSELAMYGYKVA